MSGRARTVLCYCREPKPWSYVESVACYFCKRPLVCHLTRAYNAQEQGIMEVVWLPGEPWPAP